MSDVLLESSSPRNLLSGFAAKSGKLPENPHFTGYGVIKHKPIRW